MDNISDINSKATLRDTSPVKCEKCGNEVFIAAYMLRRVSRFLIGAKNDGIIPIDTFACSKCGHVNTEFMPPELAEDTPKEKEDSKIIMTP